jgi:hypothetical protein
MYSERVNTFRFQFRGKVDHRAQFILLQFRCILPIRLHKSLTSAVGKSMEGNGCDIIEDTVPGGTEVNTRIMLTWHFSDTR